MLLLFFASEIQISLLQAQIGWPIVTDNEFVCGSFGTSELEK